MVRPESSGLELQHQHTYPDTRTGWQRMGGAESPDNAFAPATPSITEEETVVVYKVYKRRWFGLIVLMLLNIVVSWGVSCSGPKRGNE